MKKHVAITIDEALYATAKNKTSNFSRYLENLIQADLFESHRKKIVGAVAQDLLANEGFFAELSARLGARSVADIVRPSIADERMLRETSFTPQAPDPLTGYPCCLQAKPCKHWRWDGIKSAYVNSITGAEKAA